ncbi:biotin/lipoyl-containing protein [Anaerocellum diazotrophicum]|uniref:Acetyl-CoA carboxylase biotin carboxyl carrier protein subunit n=1 Tax=Caldicellulosiruptor diazotrophicus TaxID=2806205 RepID=A0ABN6E9P2_9FIRM|nr:biotin/lipoyl-containing protein [Caldicellulosiruptor diazotrophicus]BCS80321.1 acetyl-CoA carboxylase biotin carboxyl carrier protein subunit [Caldicellulosiruptor diazotrophicus]
MKYIVTINGKKFEVEVERVSNGNGHMDSSSVSKKVSSDEISRVVTGGTKVSAPMPGKILSVNAKEGQKVKKGDVLFILEAMKMENEIMAPEDGVVEKILVSKGAQVASGDILAILK